MNNSGDAELGFRPSTADGRRAFVVTPFARLARTHAGSAMADAMVTAALADSLFFSMPADAARAPVVRYLVITMLPFAVISPLVGPMIDRLKGGQRYVLLGTAAARALLCFLMLGQVSNPGATFFLLALCVLVAQKAYSVARSALVPSVVRGDDALVEANSKLSLISGIAGFVGIVPAAILLTVFGADWALGLAMCTYVVAAVVGLKIPPTTVAAEPADVHEREELRGAGIIMAGSAMGLIRMCVGFLTLLIAFDFRGGDRPAWEFGLVGAVSVLSQLAGAVAAPKVRQFTSEENLLTGVLGLVVFGGLFAVLVGDVTGAAVLGGCVGFAAGSGKLAFDSILQRDAPGANRGRSFARFETRFQVSWVLGAFAPVAFAMGAATGFFLVLVIAVIALGSYSVGRLALAHKAGTRQNAATAAAVGIEARFAEVSGEVKGRLAAVPRSATRRLRRTNDRPPGPEDLAYEEDYGYEEDDAYEEDDGYEEVEEPGQLEIEDVGWREGEDPDRTPAPRWQDEAPTLPAGLAGGSPLAWDPDGEDLPTRPAEPWMPGPAPIEGDYLEDVDPGVANPYPWSAGQEPEDPGPGAERTRHEPRYRPRRHGRH